MKNDYSDILTRLGPPLWWDELGVPRYDDFSPQLIAFPSNNQAALIEIACQSCGQTFQVSLSSSQEEFFKAAQARLLKYGDPPVAGCCELGATMNSEPRKILQFWKREKRNWQRQEGLEGPLECLWAKENTKSDRLVEKSNPAKSHAFVKKLQELASKKTT